MEQIQTAVFTGVVALLFSVTAAASANTVGTDYAIVVSKSTLNEVDWQAVADALVKKHQGVIIPYDTDVASVLPALKEQFPRYTCFLAQPDEATADYVRSVHQLTRRLDEDPYTDTLWAILTGHNAKNALEIASHSKPLLIRKVASGTEVALEMCQQGVWYDELVKHKEVKKEVGGKAAQFKGPGDTTRALAETLTDYKADLFVTSGHEIGRAHV